MVTAGQPIAERHADRARRGRLGWLPDLAVVQSAELRGREPDGTPAAAAAYQDARWWRGEVACLRLALGPGLVASTLHAGRARPAPFPPHWRHRVPLRCPRGRRRPPPPSRHLRPRAALGEPVSGCGGGSSNRAPSRYPWELGNPEMCRYRGGAFRGRTLPVSGVVGWVSSASSPVASTAFSRPCAGTSSRACWSPLGTSAP